LNIGLRWPQPDKAEDSEKGGWQALKKILETERLYLREMTNADYGSLAAILQDTETMYAYEGAYSDAETREWLDKMLRRYEADGFGLWAAILKESGIMIGQVGITWQSVGEKQVPEIGYLLNRNYWGKGYAIEAAGACKKYAFDILGFDEIFSIVRDTNIPSMNVAIRNGMVVRDRFAKRFRGVDMPHLLFSVVRPAAGLNWQGKSSRSSAEMAGKPSRPAMAGKDANVGDY
jgi:RimJ/RimL family protein N-acetyltransferase